MNAEIEKYDLYRDGVSTEVDVFLTPNLMTVEQIDGFRRMEPFGNGNSGPCLALEGRSLKRRISSKTRT